MVHIFYCPASLRVSSNGYFYFPATHCRQPSVLEYSFFSCQTASSSSSELLLLHLLLVPSFSVVLLQVLLLMGSLFAPWGLLSMSVFQSSIWMVSFLSPHISCHYTEILQWPANLSNRLVGNSHSVVEMFLSLDWFFLFGHLFKDGIVTIDASSGMHGHGQRVWRRRSAVPK